jgi:hypothetical protein
VFKRMRELLRRNRELEEEVARQADTIKQLQWDRAADRQCLLSLQAECEVVRTATRSMANLVSGANLILQEVIEPPPVQCVRLCVRLCVRMATVTWCWSVYM